MPTTTWNQTTIDGVDYLVIEVSQFLIPLDWDPSSNMFIAVAAPMGGLGAFPALVKGDTGDVPTFGPINYTFVDATDPTPDSATWTQTGATTWQLNIVLHRGPQGIQGDTVVDTTDFGTPVAKKILVVNDTLDAFVYQTQKVGDRYVPASVNNTALGNPLKTLCSVAIPPQDFDWRPEITGQCIVDASSSNVRVDLIARLDAGLGGTPEIDGNIVGRSFGIASALPQQHIMSSGPPTNASATYDKVLAGASAVVYFRAERIAGTGTFTTSSDTSYFGVRVCPIP